MKTRLFLVAGLFIFSVLNAYAYDNHDFQVWNIEAQEFKVSKTSKVTLEEEFRWGNNASDFYYQHYDVGYVYLFNDYFNFSGGYRYVLHKVSDKFRESSQPYLTAFMYWNPAGFNLTNRIRLEYRYYDYQSDTCVFRNKLDVKFPWKFTKFAIQPMIAEEIFFKLNGGVLDENRLSAGLAFNLTRNLKGEICYMLRSAKAANTCVWVESNVLSTKLKLSF